MKQRHVGIGLLAVAFVAWVCFPRTIEAYAFSYTEGGTVIKWEESCFYYTLHQDGAPGIDIDELAEAVRVSFDQWNNVTCSYFTAQETAERASCAEVGFNKEGGNMNLLVWRSEAWPWDKEELAITSVLYNMDTGRILDADIEFNGVNYTFGLNNETGAVDVKNTATHEIGHMLGLEHSTDWDATMSAYAFYEETTKRDLAQDDIDAICSLYPLEEDPEICQEPLCGLNTSCTPLDNGCVALPIEETEATGCSAAPVAGPQASAIGLFATLILTLCLW